MTTPIAIAMAVCLTSALGYVLLVRADRRRDARRSPADNDTRRDSGVSDSGTDGSGLSSWFFNTSTDAMGNPIDGGGDSGCGDGGGDGGGD